LGREEPLARPPDFRCDPYLMYKRPGLDEFLAGVAKLFEVCVWSSGSADYVECIVREIFTGHVQPLFVWSRERCTRRTDAETGQLRYLKDMKKVRRRGYALAQVLMVDDDPAVLARSYGNLVRVVPYDGSDRDAELRQLLPYLRQLLRAPDVRKIDKRAWRTGGYRVPPD